MINQVFHEYLDQFVVVYLDDIVIFSSSPLIRFNKLWQNQLYVKKEKYAFGQQHINFLDHVIEYGKIQMDEDKLHSRNGELPLL